MSPNATKVEPHPAAPVHYYSQSELARRLNLTPARAAAAIRRGAWQEDAMQGTNKLFLTSRLEELRAAELAGRGK